MKETIPSRCGAVLIVEDQDEIREELRGLLMDDGYRVYSARDRESARDVLERERVPCLILADAFSARVTGRELVDLLRPEDVLAAIPVVFERSAAPEDDPASRKAHLDAALIKRHANLDSLFDIVEEHCGP
jgi:CheY-like chemotaxis protein